MTKQPAVVARVGLLFAMGFAAGAGVGFPGLRFGV